jgi:hypothetical protein
MRVLCCRSGLPQRPKPPLVKCRCLVDLIDYGFEAQLLRMRLLPCQQGVKKPRLKNRIDYNQPPDTRVRGRQPLTLPCDPRHSPSRRWFKNSASLQPWGILILAGLANCSTGLFLTSLGLNPAFTGSAQYGRPSAGDGERRAPGYRAARESRF